MMGISDPQPSMFYHINLEQFVTADHPMRKIRPLIDTARLRQLCEPLIPRSAVHRFRRSNCFWPESLSMCWVARGARVPFAAVADDYLYKGGNSLTDHLTEETASELDEALPCHTEFILECSFHLDPYR
jgi:hypothetical protein